MRKFAVSFFVLLALAMASSACKEQTIKTVPERQGARGESCLITNDCKSGLLCIAGRCIDQDFALEATAKVCVRAQCIDTSDCCRPPSKSEREQCDLLKQECDLDPLSFACDSYAGLCGPCTSTCENHSCVSTEATVGECTTSAECRTGELCIDGDCVECGKDSECGEGYICESNSCQLACIRDEQCGAMAACNAGRCEARGCQSDRACVAFIGRPDAVCAESGECSIPCDNDGGCASLGGLFSCVGGYCEYAGCETNAECAAADEDFGRTRLSLCLDRAEADKVTFGGF
jgi:hypothetical protein